ncbi:XRE family transcriptional regulator [Streptomyces alboniger]|uniref:XRE family transcriptional regulator n=2 Tax=Streptomyces alboniger TaxID=132473 RepID=A0A5J6I080_STRAD|nr:XRE family transcriptional regulator [Streptomyces alboniger]
MAASRALRYAVMAETNSIGPETFGHIRDEVTRIGAAYPRVALHEILADLTEVHDLIFRLLESGRATPAQGVDLQLLASMACGMLAKASHDLADSKSAMMQARAAYVCADQAGHNGMRAWVRGLQSLIAYWAGRPADAAAYAARGTSALAAPTGTVGVWLAALEARAHALLGDSEGVRAAVVRSSDARETAIRDDLDGIGGILTFPQPRQAYYVAEAHVLLGGSGAEAERSAEEAVRAYASAPVDEWGFGDMAGAHTNLALARIIRSDLEGAAEAVRPVLDLPPAQHNHGIVVSARRVHDALTASPLRAESEARDLRAQLELFTSTPTPALPR